MAGRPNIIISDSFDRLGTTDCDGYVAHALCLAGSCRFLFNGTEFELRAGDLLIVRRTDLVDRICPASGFRIKVIYLLAEFIELSTPMSNYGMKGSVMLFLDPVMHLDEKQQARCRADFDKVEECWHDTDHRFRRDLLIATVQVMILDFFDFHARLHEEMDISTQNASIMRRFFSLLEQGEFRKHREVTYYAGQLCVSAKYLSEVSRKVSGYAANYWINRYTALDISRLLRDKSLELTQISEQFGFSSPAYFSRYVRQHLGINPAEYRG